MVAGCIVNGRVLARVFGFGVRSRQDCIEACIKDVAAEAAARTHLYRLRSASAGGNRSARQVGMATAANPTPPRSSGTAEKLTAS